MWVGKKAIKTKRGVYHFKSRRRAKNWERVARAFKHGWRPKGRRRKR